MPPTARSQASSTRYSTRVKPMPIMPASSPSTAKSRYSGGVTAPIDGRCRNAVSPNAARPISAAVTLAIATAPNDVGVKSRSRSSRAKNTPATGALNVAEMPPAAPHATRVRSRTSGIRIHRPIVDPSAEPIWMMGPSRPTDPPAPMQIALARAFTTATLPRMRPPFRAIANITSGTPWPRASRAKRWMSGPYSSPPTAGASTTNPAPSHGTQGFAGCPVTAE